MFKQNKKIVYGFVGLMILIIAIQYLLPKPTDLGRNYLNKNKSPFGCYAIYNLIDGVYSENMSVSNQTIYNLNNRYSKNTSLLIINDNINFNKSDVEFMYDFLSRGNTVFLAANDFSGPVNDSLHLLTHAPFYNFSESLDSLIKKPGVDLQLLASNLRTKKFSYPQLGNATYFSNYDSTKFKVLAYIDKNKPCLIRARINSGSLYLMSMPDVFGNYFVASHKNREVAYACLSMIKNQQLVWDEYYKTYNSSKESPIKFILESDALYSAYLLAIACIIIYMIFEGRRRQRAIPVIEPPQNSTLEFVNVISHVYYNSNSHKSIALEKIKYFYESLRKKFGVDTNALGDQLYEELSVLSGIDKDKLRQLLTYCQRIKAAASITEYELLELNRQIDNFNKNSLR